MKKAVFLLLAVVVIACGNRTAGKVTGGAETGVDDGYVPQRSDYSFRTEVRTVDEDDEVHWDSIIVYLTDAKGKIQKLYCQALPLDTMFWDKGSIGDIEENDWNFDGIPDLQVCTGPMNTFGNLTYDVWLWNDKTHQFEKFDYDCEIYSPEIDAENKCIVSTWRLDDDVEFIRYQWKDGKLVEVGREKMSYSEMMED